MSRERRDGRPTARLACQLLAALFAGTALVPLLAVRSVSANAGPCEGNYRERHLGWYQNGQKWGAEALLTTGAFTTCTNPTPFTIAGSFAWTNIQGSNGTSSIVQIGVGRCRKPLSGECDGNRKVLYAWGREASASCLAQLPFPQEIAVWDGSAGYAKVVREGSNWVLYWKGVAKKTIPYSWTSCSWSPTSATWFTETWNDGDSNGGDAGHPYLIRHMAYQNSIGGAFTYVNTNSCNINDGGDPQKYFCAGSGDQVSTWTVQ